MNRPGKEQRGLSVRIFDMNWSTVKNLLIAMLVAANIFLIYNISVQTRTKGYISTREVEDAAALLSERGLTVVTDGIPFKRLSSDVYESFFSDDYYVMTSEKLSMTSRASARILPDGGMMILSENGSSFELYDNLGFIYHENSNIDSKAYTDITAEKLLSGATDFAELRKTRLTELSVIAREFLTRTQKDDPYFGVRIDGGYQDPESGLSYVIATQMLDDLPVSGHQVVCVFEGSELRAVSGFWYFEKVGAGYNQELLDQINVLFNDLTVLQSRFAEDGQSDGTLPDVVNVSACYSPNWNAERTAIYFIPSWQIEHSDGTIIVYNAVNGGEYLSTR